MPKKLHQGVPFFEHPSIDTRLPLNWEDVRVFLVVARNSSFRAAARELGLSFNTVRRHVECLERHTGGPLLARHPSGIGLTGDGLILLNAAQEMEMAAERVVRIARKGHPTETGRVRINITEGLGTLWLVPRAVSFQRAHPNIILEATCTFREPDLVRMESDLSVQLVQPKQSDLKVARIGRMHVMPFASPDYLRIYGTPKTLDEVANHKIVEQLSPQLDISAVDRLFPGKPREGFVSIVTNTSTAHLWAVAHGAGIGMLPTYVAALGANVVPIDLGFCLFHDIWMSYHPEIRKLKRVSLAVDFLKSLFDRTRYPWFQDIFVHPSDFPAEDEANPISRVHLRFPLGK
ncbi:MAG: LysR family transcriptional regulator [Alphaproteobacteria bacterium]|nr:LysR family transcriptional regulator [Alphaproteobacteria bacterium]